MTITNRMKDRFCKDCNLPIKIFDEPYFTDRLNLLDAVYGCKAKYDKFISELEKAGYNNEEEYFAEYNRVKDNAINFIKETEEYQRFNACDMNEFGVKANFPSSDIYKPSNNGKRFISIDMKKANFSALRNYDATIFDNCKTWEEFVSKFTSNQHIINSKYIRQVILGNCNPKRHITYEKYITYHWLISLINTFHIENSVVFFSNDEIVFDGESVVDYPFVKHCAKFMEMTGVEFRVTDFVLHQIKGTQGYYKDITNSDGTHSYEFKCLASHEIPFVIRAATGQSPCDLDKYFITDSGRLASFVDTIEVDIPVLYE